MGLQRNLVKRGFWATGKRFEAEILQRASLIHFRTSEFYSAWLVNWLSFKLNFSRTSPEITNENFNEKLNWSNWVFIELNFNINIFHENETWGNLIWACLGIRWGWYGILKNIMEFNPEKCLELPLLRYLFIYLFIHIDYIGTLSYLMPAPSVWLMSAEVLQSREHAMYKRIYIKECSVVAQSLAEPNHWRLDF
jgi:hypothetical protein